MKLTRLKHEMETIRNVNSHVLLLILARLLAYRFARY
jgi:hypothetical protein